ncbi:hypothetical protein ACRQ5D_25310 [Mucilaginibacter sp. P25]|uniref:Uncharacterized protein n=1 Tax=Mucilaginibacter gossypii TaxID=551996 RepID=A0A1G7TEB2_9SPHI|nr:MULTISPECIES: hypothetical protein [Mucilaginibacter]QTE38305.1 hypothetical protein J3L18_04300 [Mucilaginibacter gossypii]SDG33666.1 hypothetical protein SAMN05192573_103132 [Mucilaginibacter gossypii]
MLQESKVIILYLPVHIWAMEKSFNLSPFTFYLKKHCIITVRNLLHKRTVKFWYDGVIY